ncbi:MAG: DNA-binding MarR family transcriptional regulator [Dinoroseobacter sp.]|jgi:DNA-binding MarR family transcriptional regulator
MKCASPPSDEIAELLVHIGRSSRGEDMQSPLTAAQWTCLRFFARANRVSRTPSAFASFQSTTRGTASQTIKALEIKGYLTRFRSEQDGRSIRLEITEPGLEVLKSDPLADMISVIDALETKECGAFLRTLSHVSGTLAELRGAHAFGTCKACTYYAQSDGGGYCACIAAELAPEDFGKLCVNFGGAGNSSRQLTKTDKGQPQ